MLHATHFIRSKETELNPVIPSEYLALSSPVGCIEGLRSAPVLPKLSLAVVGRFPTYLVPCTCSRAGHCAIPHPMSLAAATSRGPAEHTCCQGTEQAATDLFLLSSSAHKFVHKSAEAFYDDCFPPPPTPACYALSPP